MLKPQFFLALRTYPDATPEVMVANAVALARHQRAALTVCVLHVDIPNTPNALSAMLIDTASMIGGAEALSRSRGQALLQTAAEQAAAASVELFTSELAVAAPLMADAAAGRARAYDLILVEDAADEQSFAEALLFGSGRPILVYPRSPFANRIDRIAVAWDGSRAAARALGDARPLLAQASHVCLLSVVDEKPVDRESIDRLAETLTRAGVNAEVHLVHARGQSIGQALQQKAFETRADLLVMGGFGHSRLREFVLGGATRTVLGDITLPVLMSH